MRARLMMKMMGLVVMIVITVISAHSCSGQGSPASPLDPANLVKNGIGGLCADRQAVQSAAGDATGQPGLAVPAGASSLARMAGLGASAFSCPTTAAGGG